MYGNCMYSSRVCIHFLVIKNTLQLITSASFTLGILDSLSNAAYLDTSMIQNKLRRIWQLKRKYKYDFKWQKLLGRSMCPLFLTLFLFLIKTRMYENAFFNNNKLNKTLTVLSLTPLLFSTVSLLSRVPTRKMYFTLFNLKTFWALLQSGYLEWGFRWSGFFNKTHFLWFCTLSSVLTKYSVPAALSPIGCAAISVDKSMTAVFY